MAWIRVLVFAAALLAPACTSGEPAGQPTTDATSPVTEPGTTSVTTDPATGPRNTDDPTLVETSPTVSPAPSANGWGQRIEGVADPAGGDDAASSLRADPQCGVGSEPVARLAWEPAQQAGTAQVVVVTAFANGFETGSYQRSPRLSADAGSLDWSETTANTSYRWRVMTRHGDTWTPSEVGSFVGPECGVEDTS